MGATTEIAWTDHTFNIVWGCAKVSEACKNCYAEAFAKRTGHNVWGAGADRRILSDKNWNEPRKWNAAAKALGVRKRVFCSSMADVFEDHTTVASQRERLWPLIAATPWLDWQLLTKRPENMVTMVPTLWKRDGWPDNVWAGTTAENQERLDERIEHLLAVPAAIRFLSCEPLLGPLNLDPPRCQHCYPHDEIEFSEDGEPWCMRCDSEPCHGIYLDPCADREQCGVNWVIVGGESGPGARPFDLAWARSLLKQCADAAVPAFFKQAGRLVVDSERKAGVFAEGDKRSVRAASELGIAGTPPNLVALWNPKGGDLGELPADLHVRQFPTVRP